MTGRRIYIDAGVGETRGVIALDDRPERLAVERAGGRYPRLGERYRSRVAKLERAAGLAVLDLGDGLQAMLRLKPDRAPPTEGQGLQVEISIEPQADKLAVARPLQPMPGQPGRLGQAPTLRARLEALAPDAQVIVGPEARAMADEAEDEALAVEHPLPGGGSLAIEQTRALTAVDIDLGSGVGQDAKRAARQANLNAIDALARLLRLKAVGGLVVVDLVGRGHDGPTIARAAQGAFAAEQPGVVLGPITRFGTLELALPRRWRPVRDILCGEGGVLSDVTLALRLLRDLERQARSDPGGRILARAAPGVAAAAAAHIPQLAGIIGARLEVVGDTALSRERFEVATR